MLEEESIDLRKLIEIALDNKKIFLGIIGTCVTIAFITASLLPNRYTSTILVRTKSQNKGIHTSASTIPAMFLLDPGRLPNTNVQSYQELIKSSAIIDPVIAKLNLPEEEKISSAGFAKSVLNISNPKGTDLVVIKATRKKPEEAQFIAQNIAESLQQTLTNLNQSEQSLQINFLNNRIKLAKEAMDTAEKKLEAFRQQSQIYVPDAQAKELVEIFSEYDKKLAQLQIENQANKAKAQSVDGQLREHNVSLEKYNIAENTIVNKIRSIIIDKEVKLVDLEQRYTDKHPEVIVTKEEIKNLTASLQEEISKSAKAGTNVLNPVHGYLLQEKAIAEIAIATTDAGISTIKEAQTRIQGQMSEMSANKLNYISLERQVGITQEVYKELVTSYEQARIQETMESMDVQIIAKADLPQYPSWPNKLLFAAVGGILGITASFGLLLILYNRPRSIINSGETAKIF
ncbi:MAG: GumC family protein [Sporomusaceae bacterium]|jgi:uncharacterized protein involved in exopolysaccharide biosynthesis|nr:GumC family protein [Sporomusaceae bacterium]